MLDMKNMPVCLCPIIGKLNYWTDVFYSLTSETLTKC